MIKILVFYDSMNGLIQRMVVAVAESAVRVLTTTVDLYHVLETMNTETLVAAAGKTDHTAPEMSL